MRFFFDQNISPKLALALRAIDEDAIHLQEEFKDDTPDTEWLQYIGENDLILVTRDHNVRRKPIELKALKLYRVGAFFLGGKNLDRCQIIQQFVRNWPKMKEIAGKTKRPFAFRVPPHGTKIDMIPLT